MDSLLACATSFSGQCGVGNLQQGQRQQHGRKKSAIVLPHALFSEQKSAVRSQSSDEGG